MVGKEANLVTNAWSLMSPRDFNNVMIGNRIIDVAAGRIKVS